MAGPSLGRKLSIAIYRIRTICPGSIEPSADIAAGTRGRKSCSRFVCAHRITKDILRPVKFCWSGMLWSTVISTSKPAASAASKRRPFFSPASLAKLAVWQSQPGNRNRRRSSMHSSIKRRINNVSSTAFWLLPTPGAPTHVEPSENRKETLPACHPPQGSRKGSGLERAYRGTRVLRASFQDLW